MKYSVDRIEEGFAVCEDENGKLINIEKEKLPQNLSEGDIFLIKNGEAVILKEETQERRRLLAEKRKAILQKKNKRV